MPKGVEGKKGKGKAPRGRGHGSMRDEDAGGPGGGFGCGRGRGRGCARGRHVIPGDRLPRKPRKMGSMISQPNLMMSQKCLMMTNL